MSSQIHPVTSEERTARQAHQGFVVWFTGLSGAGKSTQAARVERLLHDAGHRTLLLDGDEIRSGLCADLGFSADDRRENLRRVAHVCRLLVEAGVVVLAAFVSPFREDRQMVRGLIGENKFAEIYCDAALDICEQRDVKGLYAKARRGDIAQFTGISSPYEAPLAPDCVIHTGAKEIEEGAMQVVRYLTPLLKKKN